MYVFIQFVKALGIPLKSRGICGTDIIVGYRGCRGLGDIEWRFFFLGRHVGR